jgi:hypothetical protein
MEKFSANSNKIDEIVQKWYHAKKEASFLEKKCNKYRKEVEEYMKKNGKLSLKSGNIRVQRKEQRRTGVLKRDLPPEVWDKYSSVSIYNVMYISDNKKKT